MGLESRRSYDWNDNYFSSKGKIKLDSFDFYIRIQNPYTKEKKLILETFRAKNYDNALKNAKKYCKENNFELILEEV